MRCCWISVFDHLNVCVNFMQDLVDRILAILADEQGRFCTCYNFEYFKGIKYYVQLNDYETLHHNIQMLK